MLEITPMSENGRWLKVWIWKRTGSTYLYDHHKGVLQDLAQAEVDAIRVKLLQLQGKQGK